MNKFKEYILRDIAVQIRLSFNHLTKEPWKNFFKHMKDYKEHVIYIQQYGKEIILILYMFAQRESSPTNEKLLQIQLLLNLYIQTRTNCP